MVIRFPNGECLTLELAGGQTTVGDVRRRLHIPDAWLLASADADGNIRVHHDQEVVADDAHMQMLPVLLLRPESGCAPGSCPTCGDR